MWRRSDTVLTGLALGLAASGMAWVALPEPTADTQRAAFLTAEFADRLAFAEAALERADHAQAAAMLIEAEAFQLWGATVSAGAEQRTTELREAVEIAAAESLDEAQQDDSVTPDANPSLVVAE